MVRFMVLAVALVALPVLAHADQVWRWTDASGRLHYSNIPEHVPAYAEPVRGGLGRLSGTVPAPDAKQIESDLAEYGKLHRERAEQRRPGGARLQEAVGECGLGAFGYFCPRLAGPWFLKLANEHDLADQVKQASLLDALGIAWRSCR
jgi:hypothetical protein